MSRSSHRRPHRRTVAVAAFALAASAAVASVASAAVARSGGSSSSSGDSRDVVHDAYGTDTPGTHGSKRTGDSECAPVKMGKRAKVALAKRNAKSAKTRPSHREDDCDDVPKTKPLKVVKTATTSYTRTYPWTISKSAAPASPVTAPGDTTRFDYTVVATKGMPVDSGFVVTGEITVSNPNGKAATGVDITDAISRGPACVVVDGLDRTIPGASGHRESTYGTPVPDPSVTVGYTCLVGSGAAGVNIATATWAGGVSRGGAPFSFGAPSTVVNDTVDVVDAFDGAPASILIDGDGDSGDDLSATTTFTYPRTVGVPASGCLTYDNTAKVLAVQATLAQASAQVEACRTPPPVTPQVTPAVTQPVVTPTGTPAATLRVTKRGPARAVAGQLVFFSITVRNTAATAATSVVLTDVLPSGYAIARRPDGATLRKGRLVWAIGDLAPGASRTARVQIRIDRTAIGTRCNTALASAGNAATVRTRACTRVAQVAGVTRTPLVTG